MNAWKTNPTRSRRSSASRRSGSREISVPPHQTEPRVGRSIPARQCSRVVLPEPEGPITAVNVPAARATDTPRSARTAAVPRPYSRCRSSARAAIPVPVSVVVSAMPSSSAAPERRSIVPAPESGVRKTEPRRDLD